MAGRQVRPVDHTLFEQFHGLLSYRETGVFFSDLPDHGYYVFVFEEFNRKGSIPAGKLQSQLN